MSTGVSPNPILPAGGEPVTMNSQGILQVPDRPILPFIEGDGTGPDIWRASVRVLDAAVEKEFGGKKKIAWAEVYAGEKAKKLFDTWLPDETLAAFKTYLVGIKGPLTTPIGGGMTLAQRRHPPDAGPLCVPAPRALLPAACPPRSSGPRRSTW